MGFKLENVQKGYAEVYFEETGDVGYVQIEELVDHIDYDKDEIVKVKRWIAYKAVKPFFRPYLVVGKRTGYKTRKEALDALSEDCKG